MTISDKRLNKYRANKERKELLLKTIKKYRAEGYSYHYIANKLGVTEAEVISMDRKRR